MKVQLNPYRMTLRTFGLLVCIVAIFALSLTHAYAAISQDEVKTLMYQYIEEQLGYTTDTLEPYNFIHINEGGWAFSLFVKDADPTTNGLIVGKMDEDGKLTELIGPQPISFFEQFFEELQQSERSYKAIFQLMQNWKLRLSQLSTEELAGFDRGGTRFPISAFINHDIRLPEDNDISYDEARKNAEEAILASPGWTQEKLDLITIGLEVYHVPINYNRPVYQFVYRLVSDISQSDAARSRKNYTFDYDKLLKEDERVFGSALPWYVSVRIDAQTGDVVGDIYIEIPPVSSDGPYELILSE